MIASDWGSKKNSWVEKNYSPGTEKTKLSPG